MGSFIYHVFSSSALFSLGLYHLISATCSHLKSPREYSAKPFYHLSLFPSSSPRLRYLPLYLIILSLLIASAHQAFISFDSDPLLKGRTPVHMFSSLQLSALLLCFLLLSVSLLLSDSTSLLPLPPDIFFLIASALFFLCFSASSSSASFQTSDLQAKCDSVSARISAISSFISLVLACNPRLFVAELLFAASLCLQGLWLLQTGLSLYVDAFIPEGCHKLLDVVSGVEGSTKCDLEDSKLRAAALLDLVFVVHVFFVLLILMVTYALLARALGRRFGSYEALPTSASPVDSNHIQMKALTGTQA
ncbi:PREDICTED: uncharacterized protein LOC109147041 [Ipomoea nil]|uniref:uncharacterized protein LOC109147041 n=1 Tax=Ipomoea nil TaxID=35883 RepID=UPI000901EECC|nr:PREDICTED: uncharacterized protein LOC109147041 [Ipomoea nil]XP_019151019.1 PREDICTED: uncharacterized protein LOC109147041 [Ipomoea nil]XP_019151719.1 PREDICTED: uncharacterized protein LOC109147041 [Ipomoea nil]